MEIKPVDTEKIVIRARELYTKHCSSITHIPNDFAGNRDDVNLLDYCIYEQLGFPEEDFFYVSFIWGELIRKNTKLSWGLIGDSQYVLYYDDDFRYVIFPYERVLEAVMTSVPQFEKFSYLTEKTVWEMSLFSHVELIDGKLSALIDSYDDDFRSSAICEFKSIETRLGKDC